MESVRYFFFIWGLTNRQPNVVSYTSGVRANAVVAFGTTNGARLMLSTPPATASDISPAAIPRAATHTASIPDAHSRFTVTAGTDCGMPLSSDAMRATLR